MIKYYQRIALGLLIIISVKAQAQNPIITDLFTADPAAIVSNDTVYLYTGHDEATGNGDFYVMNNWHCFSSTDMVNWTSHGEIFNVANISWASGDAWAGEVEERNGKFYFYFCAEHKSITGKAVGVAVSDSPYGPFTDIGQALITNDMTTFNSNWDDIDPTVYIDDDGQAYMYWGNSQCYYVKLKENMTEIDGDIVYVNLTAFTEAPYLHKYGEKYYLTYASEWPEKIAYATSNSIEGPWAFQGILNDNIKDCGTNHQSIIEYKGQSYFIYHTAAIGGDFQRSVAIDYLYYNADGTIKEIVQTSQGVALLDGTCMPIPLTANAQINDGAWSTSRKITLREGESIILNPETTEEGTWSWSGPENFSETVQMITLSNVYTEQSGSYTTTFTNNCGTDSYMTFELSINHGLPSGIVSGKTYIIKPKGSEMAVSVINAGTENGAEIVQSTLTNGQHQQWKVSNVNSYYWSLSPLNSPTRGIDVNNFSQDDDAKIQIWDYWGGETQQWAIVEKSNGEYEMVARHSGKCLDVENSVTTENARVRQWTCNDSEKQLFSLIDVNTIGFVNTINNKEIIVYGNSLDSNQISFDISQFDSANELIIFDAKGSIVYQNKDLKQEIIYPNVNLQTGVFIVKLQDERLTYTKKFIVE